MFLLTSSFINGYSYWILMLDYWANPIHQKQHFDEYARDNNFDPLVAENWYPVSYRSITPRKVLFSPRHFLLFSLFLFLFWIWYLMIVQITKRIIDHYGHRHRLALMALYPNIGLRIDKFNPRSNVSDSSLPPSPLSSTYLALSLIFLGWKIYN